MVHSAWIIMMYYTPQNFNYTNLNVWIFKKVQWVQIRILSKNLCENILSMIENKKKIQNLNSKFKFKT